MGLRHRYVATATVIVALLGLPSAARADDASPVSPSGPSADPGLVAAGAGAFDFFHHDTATEARAEYRFADGFYFVKPLVGALATNRGSVYAYGGLRADLILADHYVIMPVFTVGYYDRGNGKNLGSHTEFKSGVEFAYRFDDGTRVGIAFDHISNAGLSSLNPGTESILLMVSLPLDL